MGLPIQRALCAAVAVAVAACADLAIEPDKVPAALEIAPRDTLITAGDPARLTLHVFDEDGYPMPGPPSWAPPKWTASDPRALEIAPNGELDALRGGELRVDASVAGLDVGTDLRINPRSVRLTAPVIYLNQVIQNPEASVPLIAGREALLRVFVTGDQVSFYQPHVRADFYLGGQVVLSELIEPESDVLSDRVEEGRLDRSYEALVPRDLMRPGLELVVELDTEGAVPQSPGSETRIPARGRMPLNIIEMPVLDQTFVPTLLTWAPDERVFDWTRDLNPESPQVQMTRTLLPVGDMEVTVHETYETDADLRTASGWSEYLREIRAMWNMEGRRGYYYGVVQLPEGSAWGGLGLIGSPVSVGRPRADTYAHEVGHNTSLRHAPCGGAGGPDPDYPYGKGSSGRWGYDFERGMLVDPGHYKDLMGYCLPDWVSDYHFVKAMEYRLEVENAAAEPGAPEKTLMLWGSASSEEVQLEPAFLIEAVADVPGEAGPCRLEGFGPGGELRFAFGFTPNPVEHGGAHFLFNVPYDPARDGALERVVLSGPGGEFALDPSSTPPMAIIRDRATGRVRAIRREWEGALASPGGDVEIMVSDGLPGAVR